MSAQFCKVGKIKPNLNKLLSLGSTDKKAIQFVEVVYKKKYTKDLHVAS
ncbi:MULTISPECIES: hypothetical protein [unclassified Lacinutrix]